MADSILEFFSLLWLFDGWHYLRGFFLYCDSLMADAILEFFSLLWLFDGWLHDVECDVDVLFLHDQGWSKPQGVRPAASRYQTWKNNNIHLKNVVLAIWEIISYTLLESVVQPDIQRKSHLSHKADTF